MGKYKKSPNRRKRGISSRETQEERVRELGRGNKEKISSLNKGIGKRGDKEIRPQGLRGGKGVKKLLLRW